jgi:hypothetical protein
MSEEKEREDETSGGEVGTTHNDILLADTSTSAEEVYVTPIS